MIRLVREGRPPGRRVSNWEALARFGVALILLAYANAILGAIR